MGDRSAVSRKVRRRDPTGRDVALESHHKPNMPHNDLALSRFAKFMKITISPFIAAFATLIMQSFSASAAMYGVYAGAAPDGPPAVDHHETWLGHPVNYALAFGSKSWVSIEGAYQAGAWKGWVAEELNRKLILSVGMLPTNDGTTSLAAGANGFYDSHFITLAHNLVKNGLGNTVIRLGWEMNGSWYRWSASGNSANYVAYWRRIVTAMRAVPGANFSFNWCVSIGYKGFPAINAYPGNYYVNEIGVDSYDQCWLAGTYPYSSSDPAIMLSTQQKVWNFQRTRPEGLNYWISFARMCGKPLTLPEWGNSKRQDGHGGSDNAYYVRQMYELIRNTDNGIKWSCYFDKDSLDGVHKISPTTVLLKASGAYRYWFSR